MLVVERCVDPQEPQGRHVRKPVAVKRGQPGGNVEREQRLDLGWIEWSGAPDHLDPS
jgi:hypothetical protein